MYGPPDYSVNTLDEKYGKILRQMNPESFLFERHEEWNSIGNGGRAASNDK